MQDWFEQDTRSLGIAAQSQDGKLFRPEDCDDDDADDNDNDCVY